MIFASVLKAEPGWKAVLVKSDGSLHFMDIREWGIDYNWDKPRIAPLDMFGNSILTKENFIFLIDPNLKQDLESLKQLGITRAKDLGWIKSESKPLNDLDPKHFVELEQKVFNSIPNNHILMPMLIENVFKKYQNEYMRVDIKSAIIGLKASGKIALDQDGLVRKI